MIYLCLLFGLSAPHAFSVAYYINNQTTNGNVYTTAVGSDANDGLTPATPKFTITNLLATYTLTQGDVVYIDTGTYSNYTVVVNTSGVATNPIVFQGSTNYAAGGTVFIRNSAGADGWSLSSASHVWLRDMTIRGARDGVLLSAANDIRMERVIARNNSRYGVYVSPNSHRAVMRNFIAAFNSDFQVRVQSSTNALIQHAVLWGSRAVQYDGIGQSLLFVSNSVLRASGFANEVYRRTSPVMADYNLYVLENNAVMGTTLSALFDSTPRLSDWQAAYGVDFHSTVLDPLFADPDNLDFHPRSQFGRFVQSSGTFTNDTVTSPLIDMGARAAPFANESAPNGGRANVGAYGNTVEASRSSTNRSLLVLSFNDGGVLSGPTGRVAWVAGNAVSGDTVRVEYSPNGGSTWQAVATNVPATNETLVWNTTLFESSGAARWRVRYEMPGFTNVVSTNVGFFSLRNTNLAFYVNDGSTTGDVFTTAIGLPNNIATSNAPKDSLERVLTNHTISAGDTIYIDAGYYLTTNTVFVNYRHRGSTGYPVRIIGAATNGVMGGPVLDRSNNFANVITVSSAPHLLFQNLELRGGNAGIALSQSPFVDVNRCILRQNFTHGIDFGGGSDNGSLRNSLVWNNSQRALSVGSTNIAIVNNTIYGSRGVFSNPGTSLRFENNVIRVSGSSGAAFETLNGTTLLSPSDYNLYFPQSGAVIGRDGVNTYTRLIDYQKQFNRDWRSTVADPQFADIAAGDFRVRSEAGRWTGSAWTNDSVTSPLIDLGNPSSSVTNEPAPNGARINADAYGNTPEASRSRTNAWLQALTYADGGTLNAPGDAVYWNFGAFPSGATVRIELSTDSGDTWSIVETGIAVTNGVYVWANTNFLSSRFSRWRVVSESDTNVLAAITTNIVFRNGPFVYYINDNSTDGDVYTTAVGSDANLGTSPGSPKATLKSLVDTHSIEPGDIIYVDTGVYNFSINQEITSLDGGSTNEFVYLIGSTNEAAGGTIFSRNSTAGSAYALHLNGAGYYWIKNFTFRNSGTGIRIENAPGVRLENVRAHGNSGAGIHLRASSGARVENSASWLNQAGVFQEVSGQATLNHVVLWRNSLDGLRVDAGTASISNSVIVASGAFAAAYRPLFATNIFADYNNILAQTQALVAVTQGDNRWVDTLSGWTALSGRDAMSLSEDPLFADPNAGDFHLKTEATSGRFVPGVGFVVDSETSRLIDAGAPSAASTNEPGPNGGRVNIGMFGNTTQASKSVTNQSLYAASMRQGGVVSGTATLHWVSYNLPSSHLVRVEYSRDGGVSWVNIATGFSATAESVAWDTTTVSNSPAGLWRVRSESNPALSDETTVFFSIRNSPLSIFINDGSTAGDVYTAGPGTSTNWVASAARPFHSLTEAFDLYNLEPGDTMYVDTGSYSLSPTFVGRKHAGFSNVAVTIRGSTNVLAGGTTLVGPGLSSDSYILFFQNTRGIVLSNLTFRNARTGLIVDRSERFALEFVTSHSHSNGVLLRNSTNVVVRRSAIRNNRALGLINQGSGGTNRVEYSLILSNAFYGVDQSSGRLEVEASVLTAFGADAFVYHVQSNAQLAADYNNVWTDPNASVARFGFSVSKALNRWRELASNDVHSLSHDPLFTDPNAGDYHPRSPAGRFDPALGTFVTTDTVRSPLLDAGPPAADFSLETMPNGSRANIGIYGNHPEASRSPTNGWLYTLTLNDGGSAQGTVTLYWLAGGAATGSLVHIDYSYDGGVTWTNIATNVNASAGSVSWNSTNFNSSAQAYWRAVVQGNPSIAATNERAFSLNNQPLAYYVNDASTVGDIYTFAPGSSMNDGLTPSSPVDSIQIIFDRYDLLPGDRILVDTGNYSLTNTVSLTSARYVGSPTNALRIIGSTNWAAGGTRISRNNGPIAFSFGQLNGVELSHMIISNAARAVRVQGSANITLEWLDIVGAGIGIELIGSTNTLLRHNLIRQTMTNALANLQSTGTVWQSGTMWSNRVSILLDSPIPALVGGPENAVSVSNSIIVSYGSGALAYQINSGSLRANYNNVKLTNGALMARAPGGFYPRIYDSLAHWTRETGEDAFSLSKDPLFVNPEEGNFFLQSQAGRYNPISGTFVIDPATSPLIDAGAPGAAAFTNEPAPNGGRINIGRYGGSMFASKTPTNPAITLISWNDGGRVSGTSVVRWIARGAATNHVMGLYVSVNGGQTYLPIHTNIMAGTNQFAWNTTLFTNTPRAKLLIINSTASETMDRTDGLFAIRNAPLSFYVNDGFLSGDVYTTEIGLSTNSGLAPNSPLPSLSAVLERWDVEPGDTIYLDTGVYTSAAPIVLNQLNAGSPTGGLSVLIVGSTNRAAGGTRLAGIGTNQLLQLTELSRVTLRDLTLESAARPLLLRRVEDVTLESIDIVGGQVGLEIDGSRNIQGAHNLIRQATSAGLRIAGASNLVWRSSVLWSNATAIQMALSTNYTTLGAQQPNVVSVSNTLMGGFGPDAVLYDARAAHTLRADYNALYREQGASLAVLTTTNSPLPLYLYSLERWAALAGNDRNSLTQLNPLLADPGAGDFHLRSTAGRFDPATSTFVFDTVSSPLIDAGAPGSAFTNETSPNGGRINIGRYGNTAQASRSPTNSRLHLLLYRDGGVAQGTNQLITWGAFGRATNHTVSIDVSVDGGITWSNIATNIIATAGSIVWNTTNHPSTPAALLRIRSDQEPGVTDQSTEYFSIRNSPLAFYVNDSSTTGDVYTSASGHPTNLGVSAAAPMDSLQGILQRWNLAAGDVVYVDTGVYTNNTDIFIDQQDAGGFSNTVKVAIIGSTNYAAGGSRIVRTGGNGIHLLGAGAVSIRHLRIDGATTGVRLSDVEGIDLEWVEVANAQTGFIVEKAENVDLQRCVARNCSSLGVSFNNAASARWRNGVLWDVSSGIQLISSANISVSNSIFGLFVTNGSAFSSVGPLPSTFVSDYNNFHLQNGALAGTIIDFPVRRYRSVNMWTRGTGRDANSLSHDPLFADPAGGDFHLRSAAGRFVTTSGVFVIDALTSPLIDAGSASDAFAMETSPNGGRRNIGLYGNTAQASRSPTNAALVAVSLNDGGRTEGIRDLVWVAQGAATGHTVRLEYSHDDGATWTLIASNVQAALRRFTWDTRSYISSVRGLWRIVSEQDPSVIDQSDTRFALRNHGLSFYVNDSAVAGDVYATAVGHPTNHGALASAPNTSITNILRQWDIEPGDTIYIDTGTYLLTAPIVFGPNEVWEDIDNLSALAAGLATNRVLVQGSTNVAAGGTFLSMFGAQDLFQATDAPGMAFRHLTLNGGSAGIRINNSAYTQVEWCQRVGGISGFAVQSSPNTVFRHNVVRSTSLHGLEVLYSPQTVWQNGVMWSNPIAFYQDGGISENSSLKVENSVIGAFGSTALGYFNESGAIESDYNNIYTVGGAFVGAVRRTGSIVTTRLESISFWYNETGQDHHSLNVDPLFANALADDYHLLSSAPSGRFNAVANVWTNDAISSRLIDAGNPATPVGAEPSPNGGRANIGLYGTTAEASRTPTNGWVSILYPNDNSSIRGTITLTWHAGGVATGHLLTLQWSPVGDLAWTNIASNVPASAGAYLWNTEDYGKAACGRWRIVSQNSTSIFDVSRGCATMRDNSGSIPYFVNDSSTNGDVYCTAPGSVTNNGLLPSSPMRSVQDVLDTYKLEPVDVIYVDTGNYLLTQPIRITDLDSGSATNRVTLQGSTNWLAGGTVFDRQEPLSASSALLFEGASGWNVYDIRVKNGAAGIALVNSEHIRIERVISEDNGSSGISLNDAANIELVDSVLIRNGTAVSGSGIRLDKSSLSVDRCTIWENFNAVTLEASTLYATSTAFGATFENGRIFYMELGADIGSVISDYNNFYTQSGALLLQKVRQTGGDIYFQYLHEWAEASGQDVHSLAHDPLYADFTNRVFFLRSATGRPDGAGGLTNDAVFSPLIDTGSKTAIFTNEPSPNGGRVNIGAYANSPLASRSPTNPWLLTLSYNDGGVVKGTVPLRWTSGNQTNGTRLRIEYSRNEGADWNVVASNVLNSAELYMWDASAEPPTSKGKWRVISQSDPLVLDENDNVFAVKNDTLTIYVNDASTTGDVFATTVGSPTNDGLSASAPLLDPSEAFTRYPLGPGDVIYIDSGTYELSSPLVLNQFTRGESGMPIRVYGSTNVAVPTKFDVTGPSGVGLSISDTSDLEFSNLRFSGGSNVVRIVRTDRVSMDDIMVSGGATGFDLQNARDIQLRRVASALNSHFGLSLQVSDARLANGVLYGNQRGAVDLSQSTYSMINSIIHGATFTSQLMRLSLSSLGEVDFNVYAYPTNGLFARDLQFGFTLARLSEWQRQYNKDIHSVRTDPGMSDPGAGDFTLLSEAGRFDIDGNLVFDATNSWAIDAGRYSDPFANETAPNGGRINAGIFGNTKLASRSATGLAARALLAATMRDGGTASGIVPLYWLSRAFSPTSTVVISYSINGGVTWSVAASNVLHSNGIVYWDSAAVGSSPLTLWRVCSEENTNLCDQVGPFTLRNGPIIYYVNDTNTSGDVYCVAPGNPTNNALSAATPQSSLNYIFDQYDLDGGDIVFVDTGLYPLDTHVFVSALDSGVATAKVRVIGSTQFLAGGTRLQPTAVHTNSKAFVFSGAQHVILNRLTLEGFDDAIVLQQQSANNIFSNLLIRDGGRSGISLNMSANNTISRSIIARMGQVGIDSSISSLNFVENSVIWDSASNAISVGNGIVSISNSVLNALPGMSIIAIQTNGTIVGDYNAYSFSGASTFLSGSGLIFDRLPQWTQFAFQDFYSLHTDPRFADPTNDLFYLRSPMGRYDPFTDTFVTPDTNFSLLIDAGPVEWDFGQEPSPNGARINIGPHANTPQASKSRTNAWLKAITAMGGGRLEGLVLLTWNYNNIPDGEQVILDYSYNNGVSWTNIGTSVVSAMSFLWQSDQKFPGDIERFPSSPIARWKITLASNTNIWDMTDNYFALRNKLFVFYVNDTNTAGDVYTCGPGNDANLGIFPCQPKATLASLLEDLDVEGEDIILIDTGVYVFGTNDTTELTLADEGKPNLPVVIRGSTNFAAGGTVFDRPVAGSASTLLLLNGRYVEVEHIAFRRGNLVATAGDVTLRNLTFTNANMVLSGPNILAEKNTIDRGNLQVSGSDSTAREFRIRDGTATASGTNMYLLNNIIFGTNTQPALTLDGNGILVQNNTIANRGTAVRKLGFGSASLFNNILKADGIDRFCIDAQTGALESDYNNLWAVNSAWIGGYRNGNWEKLLYWQREAGLDLNSIAADPRFANEAAGDFRLQSIAGRWNGSAWVTDTNHSPSIDMGSPVTVFTNEPNPNGGIVNQGFDGNTPFASKSRTGPWLMALTANDGGVLRGTNTLVWRYGNINTDQTVIVQYSPNNGATWTNISGPLPVTAGNYVWDSSSLTSSLYALWRVVLVSDTNIFDATDTTFQLRTTPLFFYVNDTNTMGDVYTVAAGSDANNGLTPSTPKRTLQALLEAYDTEGGDVVFVDTGIYPISSLNRIIWSRGGDPLSGRLIIQGSTNLAAGGSVFVRNNPLFGNNVLEVPAPFVEIRDITVQNGYYGILSSSNRSIVLKGIYARSNEFGIGLNTSFNVQMRNMRIWANRQGGVENLGGRTTTLENVTFVANSNYSYRMLGTIADTIQNNIFVQSFSNAPAFDAPANAIDNAFIDYNVYWLEHPEAKIWGSYTNLTQWHLDKQKDYRSAITNPLLNNASAGDFTLRSQFGRWQNGTFTNDAVTSWAIDRGNPASAYSNETHFNGGRINIGAFGNTPFASRSSTNPVLETRTLNGAVTIDDNSPTNIFPLIWGAINVPTGLIVNVQFSGDGGATWYTLATNVSAYQEYIIWQATPFFNTANGRWRVVGVSDTNYVAVSSGNMDIFFGQFQITSILTDSRTNSIIWRGRWNENYQVQWATNVVGNAYQWWNAVDGPGPQEKASFLSTNGGDFVFRDIQSAIPTNRFRVYRVIRLDAGP